MTLEESIGERQKEGCGTNHNQYGVCASGKTPYQNPKSIIIGSQEPRKSENGKLKRFEREEAREHAEVGNIGCEHVENRRGRR